MTAYHSQRDDHPYPRKIITGQWPTDDLVPASPLAESIIAYYSKYRDHEHLPPAPWESRLGHVRLPELGPDGEIDPLPPQDDYPEYRTTRMCAVNSIPYDAGAIVRSVAWPVDSALEPVNAPAMRIVAYYRGARHTGFLKSSPYNTQTRMVDLPAICDIERATDQRRENPPDSMRVVA